MPKSAILLLTHLATAPVIEQFLALEAQCHDDNHDVILLFDESLAPLPELPGKRVHRFSLNSIMSMGFPMLSFGDRPPGIVPGNADLPLIQFHLSHPSYDYYWVVEHDVRFTGHWRRIFDHFGASRADLLATHIRRIRDDRGWAWWASIHHEGHSIREDNLVRAFLPIYRLSGRACRTLVDEYPKGWSGHIEVKLPTILATKRCKLEDIGGEGEFVATGNENRFYIGNHSCTGLEATFRWRPVMHRPGNLPDMLWHPVKDGKGG